MPNYLLKVNSQDFELDKMTANEVNVETCLDVLRLAKSYGFSHSSELESLLSKGSRRLLEQLMFLISQKI